MKNRSDTHKIRKVTHCPKWILTAIGHCHAKYGGTQVVDTNIRRWMHRLGTFENKVITAEEAAMHPIRDAAAKAVADVLRSDAVILSSASRIPEPIPDASRDPRVIREVINKRRAAALKENNAHMQNGTSTDELLRINEQIVTSNVNVREHIEELRGHCMICVDSYLIGVRSVLADYDNSLLPDHSSALDIYTSHHRTLDSAISHIADAAVTSGIKSKEE